MVFTAKISTLRKEIKKQIRRQVVLNPSQTILSEILRKT